MTRLHVMPDARGAWRVLEEASATPLSEHGTATSAELAARDYARGAAVDAILIHDRYNRVRVSPGTVVVAVASG